MEKLCNDARQSWLVRCSHFDSRKFCKFCCQLIAEQIETETNKSNFCCTSKHFSFRLPLKPASKNRSNYSWKIFSMPGRTSTTLPNPPSLHVWIASIVVLVFTFAIVGPHIGLPLHQLLLPKDLDSLFNVSGINTEFVFAEFFLFLSGALYLFYFNAKMTTLLNFCHRLITRINAFSSDKTASQLTVPTALLADLSEYITQSATAFPNSSILFEPIAGLIDKRADEHVSVRDTLEREFDLQLSYVKTTIWALPAVGFLGTVIGLTLGFTSLSISLHENQVATQDQSMIEFLSKFSTAFVATFWGLVLTIVLAFTVVKFEAVVSAAASTADQAVTLAIRRKLPGITNETQTDSIFRLTETVTSLAETITKLVKTFEGNLTGLTDANQRISIEANNIRKSTGDYSDRLERVTEAIAALTDGVRTTKDQQAEDKEKLKTLMETIETIISSHLTAYTEILKVAVEKLAITSTDNEKLFAGLEALQKQSNETKAILDRQKDAFFAPKSA